MTLSDKMTVLIIIGSYLPGEAGGGPVRSVSNMVEWLSDAFNFHILTADRDINNNTPYPEINHGAWHTVGKAQVRYLSREEASLKNLGAIINDTDYDVLYINALFARLSLKTLWLKRRGQLPDKPVILSPRGQWRPNAMAIKSLKKQVFMLIAQWLGLYHDLYWHASSDAEASDIQLQMGAEVRDICTIPNLPIPPLDNITHIEREKSIGQARFVFLARIVVNKGLLYLLDRLKALSSEVTLDIYGHIEDLAHWQTCQQVISTLPDNITVNYCGVLGFQDVVPTLERYDCFVLPTETENYGQVIIEALSAACPVVISERTPWQDVDDAGWVIPLEAPKQWEITLQAIVDMPQATLNHHKNAALEYATTYRNQSENVQALSDYLHAMSTHRRHHHEQTQ